MARKFGATDIVTERGDDGVARIMELTGGVGADSVLECVSTKESMMQSIRSCRKGGHVSYVGVPHGLSLDGEELFYAHVHLHGGPAPVRRYLPHLIDLVWARKIHPGVVFDLTLPLDQVAEGYRAMEERARDQGPASALNNRQLTMTIKHVLLLLGAALLASPAMGRAEAQESRRPPAGTRSGARAFAYRIHKAGS